LEGLIFALFVIAIAAAEAAVGLALIISVYRSRKTVNLDELDLLQG
jgi:NADH-quinone oxidoreductase subunit K